MKRLATAAVAIALIVVLAPQASAHHYLGYRWPGPVPFTWKIVDSVTPKWETAFTAAADEWDQSPEFQAAISPGGKSLSVRKHCPFVSGMVHVCSANYGAVGWAGLTQFRVSNHRILAVRTRLNDYYVPKKYTRMVSCHELGHTLGLAHRSQSTSCMKQGITRPHPDAHDYEELKIIYGGSSPTAGTTTRTVRASD